MQPGAFRTLEFDRIVEAVRGFALTPMGDERLARLAPSADPQKVAHGLAATTEAVVWLTRYGTFPLHASKDVPQALAALALQGRALEPLRLRELASFLESVDETRTAIRRQAQTFPRLDQASAGAASFAGEVAQVRDKIDPSGEVLDHASPELKSIRDRLRKQRTRLRGTLESYLRGKDTAKYLQDQVVTERSGRYVLVIKAEHRSNIPGIVHGASASGASLFLEPLSTVEINNDIVALEQQEAEELHRILLALSDAFRSRPADLNRTIDTATELDAIHARAGYSQSIDGVEPALTSDGAFELLAARHPLLKSPVPVVIRLLPPATCLLVTGPNTGGKTVALKTAGLLALMAQAGLRIPAADGSRLPVFRSIFADIGDEQSIEASLSTFSAHLKNLAAMDRALAVPGLVLLDEVGSGTDPIEGGALGVAVVDHFRRRHATVIATSHYDALKTYASTSEGVASAAFGFNPETFEPTYQLIYGSPGRSLALEIAARLGLNPSIISAARQNLSEHEARLAEHLARMDRDIRSLEHEQRLVARQRETLDGDQLRLRQREEALSQREQAFKQRLNEAVGIQVRQARREIDAVIDDLKAKAAAYRKDLGRQPISSGDAGAARGDARAAIDGVARRFQTEPSAPEPLAAESSRAAALGDRVRVGPLGLEGVVTALHGNEAEVDVRGKRLRAGRQDLRVIEGATAEGPARVKVHVDLQPRESAGADLNVVGCSVDEAIARAERFLDESLLTDHRTVRFIHGYGTGQLKKALAGFLQQHPLVAKFATAPPDQGGGGVTVVELKD
jgi:DNA mismatch repair protein MutS2